MNKYHNSEAIYIKQVALRVMNIEKSIKFYENILGFEVINNNEDSVSLGLDNKVLLILKQAKTPKEVRSAGLYHIAYLVPKRSDLANWLYYHLINKTRIDGASHHGVSEAIYLQDIDGNGIEVYTDTSDDTWKWDQKEVSMVTEVLDIDDLFKEVDTPTNKLPSNTIIGHIHLSVLDLNKTQDFYHLIGFDTVLNIRSAAFLSSRQYHHHIGMNVWNMTGAKQHSKSQSDLDYFVIHYPNEIALNNALKNLDKNGFSYIKYKDYFEVVDVNGIVSHLVTD